MVLVDTNILAYLLIQGDRTAAAQALHARDSDWRSESFILVEFTNILATYVRTKAMTAKQGQELLDTAAGLLPTTVNVTHPRALEVASKFRISAYDARFIAVAQELRSKLVTEDAKLLAAVPDWTRPLADAV